MTPEPEPATPPVPLHIYLQGATASIVTLRGRMPVTTIRPDVTVILSPSTADLDFESGGVRSAGQAAAVQPKATVLTEAKDAQRLMVYFHLFHPLYPALRAFADRPVKLFPPGTFTHLQPAMQQALAGELHVDEAGQLMDAIAEIMLRAAPAVPATDPRIVQVMRILDADINTPFEHIAAEVGLSPSRFSHVFSREMGLSFRSYVAWLRMLFAWELVALRPDLSLTKISHTMGYADSAHLARTFHHALALTPTMMRDPSIVKVIGHPLPAGHHVPRSR